MIFKEIELKGAFIIEPERIEDPRGFFSRTWCRREFEVHGLNGDIVQCNLSFNRHKGTLRGLHYQVAPFEEDKLVRCTRGAIFDVIVDLRPNSHTFMDHKGVALSCTNYRMLYIPKGFAHGFVTLEDDTEVAYQMSEFYAPEHGRGIRFDDPAFGISWPVDVAMISEKDAGWPSFAVEAMR